MKEISKYLLKQVRKEFPKNSINIPNQGYKTFIKSMIQKIKEGDEDYNKNKQNIQIIPIPPGNIPKSSNYDYIPEKIREIIDKSRAKMVGYNFSIGSQTIFLYIVYPFFENQPIDKISDKKMQQYFDSCLYNIYVWLYIANQFKRKKCSRNLQINLYLTDLNKLLPEQNSIILEQENVNTAYTYACLVSNIINIYRQEEWFKVFIHETIHSLGIDFSDDEKGDKSINMFSKQELKKIIPMDIDILLYETYSEINAELIHLIFQGFLQDNNNNNNNNNNNTIENNVYDWIYWESIFSCFQCIKVLQYKKIKFEELYKKDIDYKENTNVFCYYVLKSLLMTNLDGYFNWFYQSNKGSLRFMKNQKNMYRFIQLFRANPEQLEQFKKMELWFSKNHGRKDIFMKTMKMVIIE